MTIKGIGEKSEGISGKLIDICSALNLLCCAMILLVNSYSNYLQVTVYGATENATLENGAEKCY